MRTGFANLKYSRILMCVIFLNRTFTFGFAFGIQQQSPNTKNDSLPVKNINVLDIFNSDVKSFIIAENNTSMNTSNEVLHNEIHNGNGMQNASTPYKDSNFSLSSREVKVKPLDEIRTDDEVSKNASYSKLASDLLFKLFTNRTDMFKSRFQGFLTVGNHKSIPEQLQEKLIEKVPSENKRNATQRTDSSAKVSSQNKSENESHVRATAEGRHFQFVFHPFLPYGKEVEQDEKISIHDVLPVKMVKFIKSMVEEAPWEAMFMKMVRLVVDQFVDKIIEKMFANKDDEEHDKWRSLDGAVSPTLSILPLHTSVERARRSIEKVLKPASKLQHSDSVILEKASILKKDSSNEMAKMDNSSWLDLFLDYAFPEEDQHGDESDDQPKLLDRKRRDATQLKDETEPMSATLTLEDILQSVDGLTTSLKIHRALRDFIKYRMLKRLFQSFSSWRDTTDTTRVNLNDHKAYLMSSHRLTSPNKYLYSHPHLMNSLNDFRAKRSTRRSTKKEVSTLRLWQSNHGTRSSNFKRDDCSLRRACNAGRLLSRLPSVEDITLQLRSFHHEPHWDALLWGMKKKRCSRIFCSRQRSPKGSKMYWNAALKRKSRRQSTTNVPRHDFEDEDATTIIPI